MIQGLTTSGSNDCCVSVDSYPSGLSYKCTGPSVRFRVPEDSDCCMKGINLRVIYSSTFESMATECLIGVSIINYTKLTFNLYKRDTVMSFNDEDWQGVKSNLGAGDNVAIFVALGHGMTVKETRVHLVHGQSSTMEVESSMTMEVEQSIMVKMEPLPEVEVQAQPNVKIDPSPEEEVQSSLDVKNEASLVIQNEPSLEPSLTVQDESSPKPNENIFVKLGKRVSKCVCLKL